MIAFARSNSFSVPRRNRLSGHGGKLEQKQEAAIAALLTCSGYTAAAKKAGVSAMSIKRWMKVDSFRDAYMAARKELVDETVLRLQQASTLAIKTLEAVMRNSKSKDSARVAAAKTVLDQALQSVDIGPRSKDDAGTITGSFSARLPMNPKEALLKLARRINQAQAASVKPPAKRRASDESGNGK